MSRFRCRTRARRGVDFGAFGCRIPAYYVVELTPELTIRGFDDELASRIRQLASEEGISLNRAVMKLLRRGAGLGERRDNPNLVGDSLDHLIGTWTAEDAAEMNRALEDLSRIDEEMWK